MKSFGLFIYALAGLTSFFWSISIIVDEAGFLGGLIAFFLFPVTIVFAPLYHGFSSGDWTLAAITYGGGILAALISGLDSDGAPEDASDVEPQAEASVVDPASVSIPSAPAPNAEEVAITDQHDLQSEKDPAEPIWLVIFGLFAAWKTSETNLEFALAYCGAYFLTGICLAGVFWLFSSKARSSWTLGRWLNNGSYSMIVVLVLGAVVRFSVEDINKRQEIEARPVASPSARNHPQYPATSQSSLSVPPTSAYSPAGRELHATNDDGQLSREELAIIQEKLSGLGYSAGSIDGLLGPRTRGAITAFQKDRGLLETGEPSERLYRLLLSERVSARGSGEAWASSAAARQFSGSAPNRDLQVCSYVDSSGRSVQTYTSSDWSCDDMRSAMRANPRNR
jgi:hypothetical protein